MKHLNPRQGITTLDRQELGEVEREYECETPKSPPGDYNATDAGGGSRRTRCDECETPKSPPGDYNGSFRVSNVGRCRWVSVKHLNPRQGITTVLRRAFDIDVVCEVFV